MTLPAIKYAIARLIKKRSECTGDDEEQNRINIKLDKLYELKYLTIAQESRKTTRAC